MHLLIFFAGTIMAFPSGVRNRQLPPCFRVRIFRRFRLLVPVLRLAFGQVFGNGVHRGKGIRL